MRVVTKITPFRPIAGSSIPSAVYMFDKVLWETENEEG